MLKNDDQVSELWLEAKRVILDGMLPHTSKEYVAVWILAELFSHTTIGSIFRRKNAGKDSENYSPLSFTSRSQKKIGQKNDGSVPVVAAI